MSQLSSQVHDESRIPGYLLAIKTDSATYHFGLNGWGYWKNDLPFPVRRETASLRMSPFSLVVRLIAAAYLAYLVWKWIAQR